MPCWTKVKATVELKNPNRELLEKALAALGYRINDAAYNAQFNAVLTADNFTTKTSVVLMADGTLSVNGSSAMVGAIGDHVNALKRGYASQVVAASAQKFGWQVTKKADNRFQLMRRY